MRESLLMQLMCYKSSCALTREYCKRSTISSLVSGTKPAHERTSDYWQDTTHSIHCTWYCRSGKFHC